MARIYHYDTTYEQEAEDGTVTASVELRIYYTVTWGRAATHDEPGYGDTAEFHSAGVEIGSTRKYEDIGPNSGPASALFWWAESFVDDHQDALLIAASERDEADADYAREMRDEMRAEQRREDRE